MRVYLFVGGRGCNKRFFVFVCLFVFVCGMCERRDGTYLYIPWWWIIEWDYYVY